MGPFSSAGEAGSQRWPEGQLPPCAGSMSPSQSTTSQWGWGFHNTQGGIDAGALRFHPRFVTVVEV